MAISVIGTPQVANANNGGDATITWSERPATGDYTVVVIGSPATSAAKGTMVTADYTELKSYVGANNTKPSLIVFYKKQGATTDTTAVGTSGNGSATDSSLIGFVLRGVDPTTFSDATPTTAGETSSTNPDPASITVGNAGAAVIVAAVMVVTKDTAITAPSGYTGYSVVGDDTDDHTLAAAYKLNCSGTEAPASWTDWSTGLWYAITIAVKPQLPPTVALGTNVVDAATITDTTPAFQFTGTDANADEVEYEVQVDTIDSFNSGGEGGVNTYYFNGSTPYDSNNSFTNDEAAFDGSTATYATGSMATNDGRNPTTNYLQGNGTNAPSSGGLITGVRARFYVEPQASFCHYNIYTSGGTPLAYTETTSTGWTSYVSLSTPSGGWSWSILQNLYVRLTQSYTSPNRFCKVEIEVTSVDALLLTALSSTDSDDNWSGTGAPNPFPSGNEITYTIPAGSALPSGDTYYWRVRATDPGGSNTWGAWSSPTRSFTVSSGTAANSTRAIYSKGKVSTSSTRAIYSRGKTTSSSTRSIVLLEVFTLLVQ